jgi:hypothetical protein
MLGLCLDASLQQHAHTSMTVLIARGLLSCCKQ